jgi:type I restriction enzyme M protein
MTDFKIRDELKRQIWDIAVDVGGAVDGWEFRQYILGTLFYRFISKNFAEFMEGGDDAINYANLADGAISDEIIQDAIKTKGYFIYPSQLFGNVAKSVNANQNLSADLAKIFSEIENSATGFASEKNLKDIFIDFDPANRKLGKTTEEKNQFLARIIGGVADLNFGDLDHNQIDFFSTFKENYIDVFGDVYEFLLAKYSVTSAAKRVGIDSQVGDA